jgi:hypothetical protein
MDGLDALAGLALPHQRAMLEKHDLLQSIFIGNVMLDGSPMPRREYFNQYVHDAGLDSARLFSNGPVIFLMASHLDPLSPGGYARASQDAMRALARRYHAIFTPVEGVTSSARSIQKRLRQPSTTQLPLPNERRFNEGGSSGHRGAALGSAERMAALNEGNFTVE